MGLRDMIRAIREYPAAHAELEMTRAELRQTRHELEQSEQRCESLKHDLGTQKHHLNFLSRRSAALQTALEEFCPRLSALGDMKQFYSTISPSLDPQGFTLYRMAQKLTGINVPSFFSYEDNRGLFEEMDGHQLMPYILAAYFHAVDWSIVPGTAYEKATLRLVDTSTPEYRAFEKQLYEKVLERMGFQDILAPQRKEVVELITDRKTELKLYCPLSGELAGQMLDGSDLLEFQDAILQRIESERLTEKADRGLMANFDGLDYVDDKVFSVFPSVEEVGGRLYGVAVCQVKGRLNPGELEQLKEFCVEQFSYGWGEEFTQQPHRTEHGDLYVSFWQDSGATILTKKEMEAARKPSRPQQQRGGEAR